VAGQLCGNPRCLNVLHLAWMTQAENLAFYNARRCVQLQIAAGLAYLHAYQAQLAAAGGVWRSSNPPP
jgi:hypothetical protein